MTPDRGSGPHFWLLTSWQWAVIGAYIVAIVLSAVVGVLANKAQDNTERIDKALCAQIVYLERVSRSAPPASRGPVHQLTVDLRKLESSCKGARPKRQQTGAPPAG
jgi:hypothetical protein